MGNKIIKIRSERAWQQKRKADAAVENTAEVTQETTEQVQDTVEQMTEDNKKELDNKKFVVDHLLSTKREGMEDLIDYMEQIGFFEAPCSGGNHLACQFGLVHHSRNVMMAAENIGYALLGKVKYAEIRDSVIIAAALHDLGKCGDFGKQMYVPNMIKDGRPTKAEPEQKYNSLKASLSSVTRHFFHLTMQPAASS